MDRLISPLPGVNVAVKSELSLILQGSNGAGVPETPYLCVSLCRNWENGGISTSCYIIQSQMLPKVLPWRYWPALNVTMHFRQANSVASRRICLNLVTTSWRAWISDMIFVIRWDSVFSVFIPVDSGRANVTLQDVRTAVRMTVFTDGWACLSRTGNGEESGGVHRNGPLCDA